MKLSLSASTLFNTMGTEATFRTLREAGFEACDYPLTRYADGPYAKEGIGESLFDRPQTEVDAIMDEVASLAKKYGIQLYQTHAPYPSNTRDGDTLILNDHHINLARKAIRATSRLGCGYMVIHPAFCHHIDLDRNEEARKINYEANMAFFSSLIPDLRIYGVRLCLENVYGRDGETRLLCPTACSHAADLAAWIDTLNEMAGEELFCACLDSGHCIITGDDAASEIRTLGSRLRCLHLHDSRPGEDAHTLPYLAELDWDSITAALREIGYEGTLNFEAVRWPRFFPVELQPAAVHFAGAVAAHIRTLWERAGE
ncbi:MAG: sugar phosphate isomerase/epimerase [Clostridia bacterium]|nr:sugar phosphate isomerase/epimerase [Clostridia bacterium]